MGVKLRPSDLARELNIDRRQVNMWAKRRERNGFPEPDEYGHYDLKQVIKWRAKYVPNKGGRPLTIDRKKSA